MSSSVDAAIDATVYFGALPPLVSASSSSSTTAALHEALARFDTASTGLDVWLPRIDEGDDGADDATTTTTTNTERPEKRARVSPGATPGFEAQRCVCDWSQDGVLAFVPASEAQRLLGEKRRIYIAHVNAPELVGTIETQHEAPIAVLQFAPLSSGRLLLSLDALSTVGVWVCESSINRWRAVPDAMTRCEFSFAATWLRWNVTTTAFVPPFWREPPPPAPAPPSAAGVSVCELKVRNPLPVPASTSRQLIPGMPCVVILARGRFSSIYERTEEPRWGFAIQDLMSMTPDCVAGDVAQLGDGSLRAVLVCSGQAIALVFAVHATVRDVSSVRADLEASITVAFGRRIKFVRMSRLPRAQKSVVVVTAPPLEDGALARWRIELWVAQSVELPVGPQQSLDLIEYTLQHAADFEPGETVLDVAQSNSSLLAVALACGGGAGRVELRNAETLAVIPAGSIADTPSSPSGICMAFSPCGTCLLVSTAPAADGAGGLRVHRLVPSIRACVGGRRQLVRYVVDCYEHAIALGWSTWAIDATLTALTAHDDDEGPPLRELVVHTLMAECGQHMHQKQPLMAAICNLARARGRSGVIECIDVDAALHIRCVAHTVASVLGPQLDMVQYVPLLTTKDDETRFLSRPVELVTQQQLISIRLLLNWVVEVVALFVFEAFQFASKLATQPIASVPEHMLESDVSLVMASLLAGAGVKVPLASLLFDLTTMRALQKLTFIAGTLGDQWMDKAMVQNATILFANAALLRPLYVAMQSLTRAFSAALKEVLPSSTPLAHFVPGVHAVALCRSMAKQIAELARTSVAGVAQNFLHSRAHALSQRHSVISNELASDAAPLRSDGGGMAAALGLLFTMSDLLPRAAGVLDDAAASALMDVSENLQAPMRIDCISRHPFSTVHAAQQCVQCGRYTIITQGGLMDQHLAWINCCPVCCGRVFQHGATSATTNTTKR
jgi:hypothetical protein